MASRIFSRFSSSFVCRSTPRSIRLRRVSYTALAEVIAAVSLYWWIAYFFDVAIHLLLSAALAPLLLLRSDQSVQHGQRMWKKLTSTQEAYSIERNLFSFTLAIIISIYSYIKLNLFFFPDYFVFINLTEQVRFFDFFMFIFALYVFFSIYFIICPRKNLYLLERYNKFFKTYYGYILYISAVISVLIATLEPEAFSKTNEVVSFASLFTFQFVMLFILYYTSSLSVFLGHSTSLLVHALFIRFWSVVLFLPQGLKEIPENWQRILFFSDSLQPPELIPELRSVDSENSFEGWVERMLSGPNMVLVAIGIAAWVVPTTFYRLSLKATFWAFLPLIYVADIPRRWKSSAARQRLLKTYPGPLLIRAQALLAAITLISGTVSMIDLNLALQVFSDAQEGEVPLNPLLFLIVVDWSKIKPWYWFSLGSAFLFILVFYWTDWLKKAKLPIQNWQYGLLVVIDNLKLLLAYGWVFISIYFTAIYVQANCLIPSWMWWLELVLATDGCVSDRKPS